MPHDSDPKAPSGSNGDVHEPAKAARRLATSHKRPDKLELAWVVPGVVFLILGVIGTLLPVIPTAPFVIVAGYCFMKGSPKLYRWMLRNRTFGPIIRDSESGKMSRKTKWLATLGVGAFAIWPIILKASTKWLIVELIGVLAVLVFIWTRPE